MKVIDLFSGCGGMSLGFQKAGYEIIHAFDNWQPAINVYSQNFNHHHIEKLDLGDTELSIKTLSQFSSDVIIGGPPCQDFSIAGKRDETLGRADLTSAFAKIVTTISPTYFVMENVDRALKANAYQVAKNIFGSANYGLTEIVLDASFCGVPQKRKRLFLIGEKNGVDDTLQPYLKKNQASKRMTVRDYLGDSLHLEHYYRHPRSYKRRGVFSIDEPSPTIRGVNRPVPANYPGHPGDTTPVRQNVRPLTTKERSLIQTFPDDFIWEGTKTNLETMIGNAVPVNLAKFVANALSDYKRDKELGTTIAHPTTPKQLTLI